MSLSILATKKLPFCPACGHRVVTQNLSKAVAELGLDPLDVVVVSDIGCCSLVDSLLSCHTVHGLHGRAVALAMGVRYGLGTKNKVIAVQGDGGATIGLQHLLEAARRNVDITLIVQNNLVYGMTGGQLSGLSPRGFKDNPASVEEGVQPYDICELAHKAGATFAARAFVGGDTPELWKEALDTKGFCLIEIVEMCTAHGVKKLKELKDTVEYGETVLRNDKPSLVVEPRATDSLFDVLEPVKPLFEAAIKEPVGVILAGSAGEGVQSAGGLLATAGMMAGLNTTRKGEYPISVGSGFSVAEVILSPQPIEYTRIEQPHTVIAVSEHGINHVSARIGDDTNLLVDDTLLEMLGSRSCESAPFRKKAGAKSAALAAVAHWMRSSGMLPVDALIESVRGHRYEEQLRKAIGSI
ncbi:MAG: 2-oxoacid:acceptor oxidoreductase family protein [Candidatus Latescibacterota bacterium]|nr:MAG: 2-oxoacid:acceptor oxidoreductase family protein [Candidatus Latescibacterota bacterium]